MEIQPVFAALRKHRIPVALIVLEIALACAVLCNALFMMGSRIAAMHIPNAIDQHGIVDISVRGADPKQASADVPGNLAAMRAIPGVIAATATNMMPLSTGRMTFAPAAPTLAQVGLKDGPFVAPYALLSGGPAALGLHLLRGRLFNGDEYADGVLGNGGMPGGHVVVVTQSLARRLWSGQDALGRQLWVGQAPYTVVGIVANVLEPAEVNGSGNFSYATFFPVRPGAGLDDYIVRSLPQDRERVMRAAIAILKAASPDAVVEGQTYTDIRDQFFATLHSMVWILLQVCVVMLAVTAFSIAGLTNFWVGRRRRQIGIRRALGATRSSILQYFMIENFLLSTAGIVLGVILAYGANLYLMAHYQLDRLPLPFLLVGAVVLWLLGQLAVLGPALRAAAVPPVVATRQV